MGRTLSRRVSSKVTVVALIAIALALLPSPPAGAGAWPRVHIGDTLTADAVRAALDGAVRRLQSPRCAEVFSSRNLLDAQGRPLQARLTELQMDGVAHLAGLSFYEGSGARACRRDDVLAFTTVGAGHVFICGPRFRAAWKKSPYLVEQTLIHEMLHTLGLGENPPSSTVITNVVRSYCDHVTRAAEE